MDKKLFSQFMWKSMFIFCPAQNRGMSSPNCTKLSLARKIQREGWSFLSLSYWLFFSFCFLHPLVQFGFTGCSKQPCYRGVFGLEQCHCLFSAGTAWFVQHQIKCPYPNQVFKQPLLFFLFCFPLSSCFEDEAFCVSTGYSNLWCSFSPECRRKRKGGNIVTAWPPFCPPPCRLTSFGEVP